jgi:hypothetical protein
MTRRAWAIAAAAVIFAWGWLGGTLTAQPVRKYFAATTAAVTAPACGAQEHRHRAIEADDVLFYQAADARLERGPRHGRDLVDHEMTWLAQSIALGGLDGPAHQRGIHQVRREGTDGDRGRGREGIVLQDDGRPGLSGVVGAARNGPDLSSFHRGGHSDTASTNA